MAVATLSIDVDDGFRSTPVARGGRVRRFISRAFADTAERTFAASWTPVEVIARPANAELTFPKLDTSAFRIGDRLWLRASLDNRSGVAQLYDGAALLVLHILQRADPQFSTDLISEGMPSEDDALVTDVHRRADWAGMLDRAIAQVVAFEVRMAASLRAMIDFMAEEEIDLSILRESDGSSVSDGANGNSILASTLLGQVLSAERAGRRSRAASQGTAPRLNLPSNTLPTRQGQGRQEFRASRDLPRLAKMLNAINEIIPLKESPSQREQLIDAIAAGSGGVRG